MRVVPRSLPLAPHYDRSGSREVFLFPKTISRFWVTEIGQILVL